ncbi:hypothetical protein PoB_003637200 [Plakobranchus ocellatus]|uniref:Uncharacterized protein n=1 Tax=Plakobranchus ocellatus TaxID=259542 RepID=A0AAV4ASF4_9GAST|nr:hypothetical protein PoB_003637200 [Plakobranchus ocellatus]
MLWVWFGSSHYDAGMHTCVSIFGPQGKLCRGVGENSTGYEHRRRLFRNVVSVGRPSPRSSHGNMERVMVCDGWLEADAVTPAPLTKFFIISLSLS